MGYPGACSLAYQHVVQILIETLFGWDPKTQKGRDGIFGVLLAWARADEEQNRKTLHGHWRSLYVKNFNKCRNALFHPDLNIRKLARAEMLAYIDKIMQSTYGEQVIVSHNCNFGTIGEDNSSVSLHKVGEPG
jgi:hypothetical protein